jgi:hypothetical protein
VALVEHDLEAFWGSLNLARPEAARDALLAFVPELTARYGDTAAAVAADWYEDLREAAGVRTAFTAALAENVAPETVQQRVRYAAGGLFADDPSSTLGILLQAAGAYALQSGRSTIVRSASRDRSNPRWARVPSGATTCAFCLVMASRGAVYLTEKTAGRMNKFHGRCDCVPTPMWSRDDRPEGYDPDELYRAYQDAGAEAGTRQLTGHGSTADGNLSILQAMRREHPELVSDGIMPSTH